MAHAYPYEDAIPVYGTQHNGLDWHLMCPDEDYLKSLARGLLARTKRLYASEWEVLPIRVQQGLVYESAWNAFINAIDRSASKDAVQIFEDALHIVEHHLEGRESDDFGDCTLFDS